MSQSRRTRKTKATALLGVGTLLAGGGIARTRARHVDRVEPPRGAGILASPQYDNTDVYAFAPGRRQGQPDRQLDPVRGAGRWPELLPVGHRRAVQDQHRQRRRRQAGHHLPLEVPQLADAQGVGQLHRQRHLPLQQRAGHVAQGPEPAVPADLRPDPHHGPQGPGQGAHGARQRAGRAVVRRRRVDAGLRARCATRRSRRYNGSRKSFAGQAEDPFFLDLRVFDLLYGGRLHDRGRPRQPGRLQRQQRRPAGAARRPDLEGHSRRRHLEHDRPQEPQAAPTSRSPGWASRW